ATSKAAQECLIASSAPGVSSSRVRRVKSPGRELPPKKPLARTSAKESHGMEAVWLNFLHLLAATVWVGGSLAIPLVITPVIRSRLPPDKRVEMIAAMGQRFRPFAWSALVVLALTGVRRAMLALGADPWTALHKTSYGQALRAKILLFIVL